MSAPEPPVGSVVLDSRGYVARRGESGWHFTGNPTRFTWDEVQQFGPQMPPLYTPPVATLVERMVAAESAASPGRGMTAGMRAALAEVASWVEEQPHPYFETWDGADQNSYAVRYRTALLAALRAEAGQ